jgi:uncharacterized membrane protein
MKSKPATSGRSGVDATPRKRTPDKARRPDKGIAARAEASRLEVVDAARGLAIAMMIAYHSCFDLTYYGWAHWAMLVDPGWVAWRSTIVASFLFLTGISLALRDAREQSIARPAANQAFVRRWLQIAGAALLVTAGSVLLFPATFIYFGVLHFVAVALWLCRRASRLGIGAAALGLVAVALGVLIHASAFDAMAVNWIGFPAHKPITEDYVPLFPWLGVVLIGCGLGALWTRRDCRLPTGLSSVRRAAPRAVRAALAVAGRWSLTIYLLHQPVLIGAMALVKALG